MLAGKNLILGKKHVINLAILEFYCIFAKRNSLHDFLIIYHNGNIFKIIQS